MLSKEGFAGISSGSSSDEEQHMEGVVYTHQPNTIVKEFNEMKSSTQQLSQDQLGQMEQKGRMANPQLSGGPASGQARALRNAKAVNQTQDWSPIKHALNLSVQKLSTFTNDRIKNFYPKQYQQVMITLREAFLKDMNNSMLLSARSKNTIYSFLSQIEKDIRVELENDEKTHDLRVCRVNSVLNNTEPKILQRFCEALGFNKAQHNTMYTIEMVSEVQKYLEENPNTSILFVFEDIEHYVETTKQVLLYKILDMLQTINIKFVFIATSMKHDTVDGFEKRIKSRFSHRQELLYEEPFDLFMLQLQGMFEDLEKDLQYQTNDLKQALVTVKEFTLSKNTQDIIEQWNDDAKNNEYVIQQLKVSFCYIARKLYREEVNKNYNQNQHVNQLMDNFLRESLTLIKKVNKNSTDMAAQLVSLPRCALIVLIAAFKVAENASMFNFEAVLSKYRNYMKSHATQMRAIQVLSRSAFTKILLDLTDKGFLVSTSETDILSVNNKLALKFKRNDLADALESKKDQLDLPHQIITWIETKSM